MSRKQLLTAIHVASQTIPFLMITATFVGIAYTCGHSLTPYQMDSSFDLIRLSCHPIH
jgi:cytochrome bd-type quinol oxidase subunit 2